MGRGIFVLNAPDRGAGEAPHPAQRYGPGRFRARFGVLDLTGDGNRRPRLRRRTSVASSGGLDSTPHRDQGLHDRQPGRRPTGTQDLLSRPNVVRDRGLPLGLLRHRRPLESPCRTNVVDRMYALHDDGTANRNESNLVDVTSDVRPERLVLRDDPEDQHQGGKRLVHSAERQPRARRVLSSPTAFFSVFFSTFTPITGACNGRWRWPACTRSTTRPAGFRTPRCRNPDGRGARGSRRRFTQGMRVRHHRQEHPDRADRHGCRRPARRGFIASSGAVGQPPLAALPQQRDPRSSWRECSTAAALPVMRMTNLMKADENEEPDANSFCPMLVLGPRPWLRPSVYATSRSGNRRGGGSTADHGLRPAIQDRAGDRAHRSRRPPHRASRRLVPGTPVRARRRRRGHAWGVVKATLVR